MPHSAPPVFGKRNLPRAATRPAMVRSDDHAAFFAAARAEQTQAGDERTRVVPRSFTAAFLAGLVTGCGLAGFDVTGNAGLDRFAPVAAALGATVDTNRLLPAMILLGLLGGARAAAMTIILVHTLLARAGCTGHAAYTLGGAVAATSLAAALLLGVGHAPAHGWPIEIMAGASGGFFYRVFAGARTR